MPSHRATPARGGVPRPLRSLRVRAALGLAVVACVATTGTWAAWTDEVPVSGATVTAGSIDLTVDGSNAVTGYTSLSVGAMVPGGSVAAVLTVRNAGTAPLRWTATSTATNGDGKGLAATLVVKVTGDTTVTGSAPTTTCAGTALAGAGSALNGALVGTGRTLAPATTEKVCVQLTLPGNAASGLQGATTAVTLTFTASSDLS
ncbi:MULTISPECIES: SipW-dependent-type signal peptide-containing protein [unclassified Nocardioides]|uniref:SipW-dependent-type signal peptide-containing protein n=1 Tax=unclassified Nocardioides TaxID=2615069 RepID=UPI0007028826|nr:MULTISPECIES: SipW-dependent-type signal peptide-containing protein [unclassified Nocardioides]KQQ41338.1 hypothetical protein ASF50_09820 [Nocardioides sp. Leaf307]